MEPTPPPADQSFPDSDQENIPPRMVTPPPLNVLIPIEEETRVKECFQRTLAVMDMAIFRTIFFELLVFFTFTLLTFHFAY